MMAARLKPLNPGRSPVHKVGALLRAFRIAARLSQPELAQAVHSSKSTISRAETGARLLPRDLVEACDTLLGASGLLLQEWQGAVRGAAASVRAEPDHADPPRPAVRRCTLAVRPRPRRHTTFTESRA
jgi:transcriptional regulator with XRE-family HTH domain